MQSTTLAHEEEMAHRQDLREGPAKHQDNVEIPLPILLVRIRHETNEESRRGKKRRQILKNIEEY